MRSPLGGTWIRFSRGALMDSDSVSYGPEPGFLFSDGMSGGTACIFVPPWCVYPGRIRRSRGTVRNSQRPPQDLRELPSGIRRGLGRICESSPPESAAGPPLSSVVGGVSCEPPRRRQGGCGGDEPHEPRRGEEGRIWGVRGPSPSGLSVYSIYVRVSKNHTKTVLISAGSVSFSADFGPFLLYL